MAKRSRGSSRPGRRAPKGRSARPAEPARPSRPPTALSQTEEARAAELEAQIVAQERAAESERLRAARTSGRARDEALPAGPAGRGRSGGLLAARASARRMMSVGSMPRLRGRSKLLLLVFAASLSLVVVTCLALATLVSIHVTDAALQSSVDADASLVRAFVAKELKPSDLVLGGVD